MDIRPIPEGRKRQVTFMKRKTGLLKKAMELSILCQCEMAVVIFNHNGKLYDYGSTNIHKTIRRFKNKGKPDGSYEPEVRVHATGAAPQLHRFDGAELAIELAATAACSAQPLIAGIRVTQEDPVSAPGLPLQVDVDTGSGSDSADEPKTTTRPVPGPSPRAALPRSTSSTYVPARPPLPRALYIKHMCDNAG